MNNSSISRRLSLSNTNLTSPIAESTCLDGARSHSKFNWGEGTMSPRNRNESHSFADKSSSMSKNLNGTPTKVSMSPSTRIDPRTYVDIHSNGLASRIVKYHDNSTRLNRSLSMGNLYNKPGQFPVVHLKKNEQQYKAKKTKNLSMTRIAAPEKSAFHGNTLSSILRSGSIVGLQKSDEEISRENRPILHPPPTENEMAPTRSVLEVLKEISRKRINSDEIDGTELIKKHCKEAELDTIPFNGERTHSKRQREITNSASSNVQISPEQHVLKKRICNYNNDIMSSLSSSMLSVNKKRVQEIQSQKRSASDLSVLNNSSTSSRDIDVSRSEKQRCIGNFDLTNLASSTKYSPITPLPSTPQQPAGEVESVRNGGIVTRRASEPVLSNAKPKITLFNKDYDEVPTNPTNFDLESREDGDLCGIQFVKPKKSSSMSSGGSLLMEKTKKSKLALMLSGLKGELDEEDEIDAATPRAEPQKTPEVDITTSTTSAPPISESLSLSSTAIPVASSSKLDAMTKSVSEDSKTTPTVTNGGLTLNPLIAAAKQVSNTSSELKTDTAPLIPPGSSPNNEAVTTTVGVLTNANPSITASMTLKPTSGGFSFGLDKANTISTVAPQPANKIAVTTSMVTPAIKTTDSVANAGTKTFSFGLPSSVATASTAPSFSFGLSNNSSQQVGKESSMSSELGKESTKTTESAPVPTFGQTSTAAKPAFSFGLPAGGTINTTVTTVSPSATTSTPSFSFGTQKSTWSPPVAPATAPAVAPVVSNTNSVLGVGSFGGIGNASAPASNTSVPSTGGFSFGLSASTEPPKLLFGNINPSTTSSTPTSTFSFSTNKTTATPSNQTNTFTFGSAALPQATANNSTPTFGSVATQPTVNPTPSFGSVAVAPVINPAPAFGSSQTAQPSQNQSIFGNTAISKPATNTFSFGGSSALAAPQKSAFTFSASADKPTAATTNNSIGGFSFNNPSASSVPAEANKNIFGAVAPTAAAAKPTFSFGSATTTNQKDKPSMFGATSTNHFGAPAAHSATQNSSFTFGSSNSMPGNQGASVIAPNTNLFGQAAASTNPASGLGAPSQSNSMFGTPSAVVAPLQQTSAFTFGGAVSNNTNQEANKSAGGFVFGSSSSIGSNASKPPVDMNKTFVFGDGNTTITAAPPGATSLFGGSNVTNGSSNTGSTDNKIFSFGAAAGGNHNTFAAPRQTSNPSPAFNFGTQNTVANITPDSNNLIEEKQENRVIRKAMRRLHKT